MWLLSGLTDIRSMTIVLGIYAWILGTIAQAIYGASADG